VYETLARETGDPSDRITLADLTLRAGDAPGARRLYEEALKGNPTSAEALRGAARAAAGAGDRDAALGYWRRALEASPPGGTAWYEARLAEVALLAQDGRKKQACDLIRTSRGPHPFRGGAGRHGGRQRGTRQGSRRRCVAGYQLQARGVGRNRAVGIVADRHADEHGIGPHRHAAEVEQRLVGTDDVHQHLEA